MVAKAFFASVSWIDVVFDDFPNLSLIVPEGRQRQTVVGGLMNILKIEPVDLYRVYEMKERGGRGV